MGLDKRLIFLVIFQTTILIHEINGEAFQERDFGGYHSPEYPIYPYPPNYHQVNDDPVYVENPTPSFVSKGINFLIIKLGVLGLIKGFMVFVFALFLFKIPLLILKALLIKSLFLPVIAGPLLLYYYFTNTNQGSTVSKPTTQAPTNVVTVSPAVGNGSRNFEENNPMSLTWQSIKMFAENEQCLERIYCKLGASNDDSYLGSIFLRALEFLNGTSSSSNEKRISSLMKAYNRGRKTLKCPQNDFKCQAPEVTIQQGSKKIKVF